MQIVASAIAITVLVASIAPKLISRAVWRDYLAWARALPGLGRFGVPAAMLALAAEVGLVAWIAVEYDHARFSVFGFAALLTVYSLYTLFQLSRGRHDLKCMCFGATPSPLDSTHAITNLVIAAATVVLAQFPTHAGPASALALATIGVLLAATAISIAEIGELLRPALDVA